MYSIVLRANLYKIRYSQGFSKFHFTPLKVLAVIEGVQKRTGKTFTREQIESGILKDIITNEDYDVIRVVSRSNIASLRFRVCCIDTPDFTRIRVRKTLHFFIVERRIKQRTSTSAF